MGQALPARLHQRERERYLATSLRAACTADTLMTAPDVSQRFDRVRADGYARVTGEPKMGLRLIAMAAGDMGHGQGLAINIGAHAIRMSHDRIREACLPPLRRAATRIVRAASRWRCSPKSLQIMAQIPVS